jgi:hypothetical protein
VGLVLGLRWKITVIRVPYQFVAQPQSINDLGNIGSKGNQAVRFVRDIYTSASLIFNCARGRRGRQQNGKRCSQDAEQNRCAAWRIHPGRAAMYLTFDHKKRKPARALSVSHIFRWTERSHL